MKNKHRHEIQWADANWFPVRYGFCPSEKAWDAWMKLRRVKGRVYPISQSCAGCCSTIETDDGIYCLVTVDGQRRTGAYSPSLCLVHEAVHVKQHVTAQMGEDAIGIEFEAYAIQHISAFLMDAYARTRGLKP